MPEMHYGLKKGKNETALITSTENELLKLQNSERALCSPES